MEKKTSNKKLQEMLRNDYFAKAVASFEQIGDECLQVATNEFAIPTLDSEGNEQWVVIKVSVPTGTRDGDAYDGYNESDCYKAKVAEKAEKAKKLAEAKAKKVARDEKMRAEKKAKREQAKAQA